MHQKYNYQTVKLVLRKWSSKCIIMTSYSADEEINEEEMTIFDFRVENILVRSNVFVQ